MEGIDKHTYVAQSIHLDNDTHPSAGCSSTSLNPTGTPLPTKNTMNLKCMSYPKLPNRSVFQHK